MFVNKLSKCTIFLLFSGFLLLPHSTFASQKADLAITQIAILPGTPLQNGGEAMIRVTVENIGNVAPSKNSSLNAGIWSVSQNGTRVNGTNIPMLFSSYSLNIPKLDPGKKIRFIKKHRFQYAGRHRVEAWINTDGFVAGEEVNTNNFSQKYFNVIPKLPDLVVCSKTYIKSPPHAKSRYRVTVRNIGNATSASCNLRFRIQKKGIKHFKIPELAPGKTHTVSRSVYWASRRNSNFSLHIDSKDQVREMNANDNNILKGVICTQKYCRSIDTNNTCSNVLD